MSRSGAFGGADLSGGLDRRARGQRMLSDIVPMLQSFRHQAGQRMGPAPLGAVTSNPIGGYAGPAGRSGKFNPGAIIRRPMGGGLSNGLAQPPAPYGGAPSGSYGTAAPPPQLPRPGVPTPRPSSPAPAGPAPYKPTVLQSAAPGDFATFLKLLTLLGQGKGEGGNATAEAALNSGGGGFAGGAGGMQGFA